MLMRRSFFLAALALTTAMPSLLAAADGSDGLKVMTFNIRFGTAKDGDNHWDRRKEFVADVVKNTSPDLLGAQEVLAFQRDFLAENLSGYDVFSAGRDDGKEGGEMTPVYWRKDRFEKLSGGHFWLSDTPEKPGSKGWDAALPRVATWVTLKDRQAPENAAPILFINTHFDHMGKQARIESGKLLRSMIAKLAPGAAAIVTGDFNAGEATAPYTALFGEGGDVEAAVADSYRLAHPTRAEEEGTFNGFKPSSTKGERIDWIGVSRSFKVSSAEILRTTREGRTPSDHFPVVVELKR